MSGTVSSAGPGSTALLYLDGSTIPYAKADASSGTWSIPLSALAQGSHSYSVAAGKGWSPGPLVSGTFVESAVSTPTVTFPSSSDRAYPFSTMTGTISWPVASSKAALYLGSSTTPFATVDASSGSWRIPIIGVAVGSHAYTVKAFSGTALTSATATGTFTLSQADRIGGVDRYDTAVRIAQAMFPTGSSGIPVPVLYIANGLNYPDGLSAAAAAAKEGGAMLLTDPSALPSEVSAEITALNPTRIVVAGGTASVSAAVYGQLSAIVGPDNIVRRGGATRYGTSAALAAPFTGTIDTVFIANGSNFPDALSESAAAAKEGSPVILVPGADSSLDAPTLALLHSFSPNTIVVGGGTGSISAEIAAQLAGEFPGKLIERLGGNDRYETARVINAAFFTTTSAAYIATGDTFPDALAGGVIAAWAHAPLVVTSSTCVESYDLQALNGWGTTSATLLGGTGALSNAVQSMISCG
jgi:putative cell wall-binding protein